MIRVLPDQAIQAYRLALEISCIAISPISLKSSKPAKAESESKG